MERRRRIQRLLIMIVCLLATETAFCQTNMRIHYKNGNYEDYKIEEIDSITFVDASESHDRISLSGCWLWGDVESGYYELLTFNDDKTYTGYDNYFTYGFETKTYGWYFQTGSILTLQSNGYGYQRMNRWFLASLTPNALEVMTKMGTFVYYKLQDETINLRVSTSPFSCQDGETIIFADGVLVQIVDNKLIGLAPGISYILKFQPLTNTIGAYKVIIEP